MIDSIFRQYDIRGKVGTELLLDEVYDLGRALAYYLVKKNPELKTVALGMDGRTHSQAIKEQLCKALLDSGLNVVFIGVCPTPVLYFALFTVAVDAGIMITASHNTKEYNGFKICLNKESVWGDEIQKIKELYKQRASLQNAGGGHYNQEDVITEYITWMKNHFPKLVGMTNAVLVDCGNGAAGTVLPRLIQVMQWSNVQLLFPEVDGSYPNHEADPVVEKNMRALKEALQSSNFSLGIGLDGDCDRMAPMTKEGQIVAGDKLLAIFAHSMQKEVKDFTVVFDIKCSAGLIEVLDRSNIRYVMAPSGHSIIKDQMKKNKALLAGELSCHFFFKDRYFGYDDGIYAMMRLFEILMETGKTVSELLSIFPEKFSTPEYRIDCTAAVMSRIVEKLQNEFIKKPDVKLVTLDGIRVIMKDGWGMVRPSNTQPVLCLRFESDSLQGLERIKHEFIELIRPYMSVESLQELE